jgi:hypothetical protein
MAWGRIFELNTPCILYILNIANYPRWISYHHCIRWHIMDDNAARSDFCAAVNDNATEDNHVRADLYHIPYHRTWPLRTVLHNDAAYSCGLPKDAITADDRTCIYNQGLPMMNLKSWANGGTVLQFNPKKPFNKKSIRDPEQVSEYP